MVPSQYKKNEKHPKLMKKSFLGRWEEEHGMRSKDSGKRNNTSIYLNNTSLVSFVHWMPNSNSSFPQPNPYSFVTFLIFLFVHTRTWYFHAEGSSCNKHVKFIQAECSVTLSREHFAFLRMSREGKISWLINDAVVGIRAFESAWCTFTFVQVLGVTLLYC